METAFYNVTCHTVGCENCDITIFIEAPAVDPNFMCGACMEIITDYQLVENEA
jgi:hypothetical protein